MNLLNYLEPSAGPNLPDGSLVSLINELMSVTGRERDFSRNGVQASCRLINFDMLLVRLTAPLSSMLAMPSVLMFLVPKSSFTSRQDPSPQHQGQLPDEID